MNLPVSFRFAATVALIGLLTLGPSAHPVSAVASASPADIAALNQALIDAAAQGQANAVTLDVYRGADVNAVDRFKRSPLTACTAGEGPEAARLKIIKMLVGLGADVNQHSLFQPTPLLIAIDYGQTQIAQYLLRNGADPTTFDSFGDCALTHAARTGQLDLLNSLLQKGADVRSTDHKGRTPLMWASGSPAFATTDVEYDEVTASETGYTVIHCVHSGIVDMPGGEAIVRTLLAARASIEAVDNDGNTALMIAAGEGKTEIVRALIEAHADWRRRNDISDTALMCAAKGEHDDTVAYLKAIGGARDPVYLALEKRIEGLKAAHETQISRTMARQSAAAQSDLPGLSLRVYADSEFIVDGKAPTLHYVLENQTNAPISLISPGAGNADSPAAAKTAWSVALIDNNRTAHPQQPDFPTRTSSGGTIGPLATIGIITVPAHGRIELPVGQKLSPVGDNSQTIAAPGIYRAAFYYTVDPRNLPYATDEVHAIADRTSPCRLVSNEITIVNE